MYKKCYIYIAFFIDNVIIQIVRLTFELFILTFKIIS